MGGSEADEEDGERAEADVKCESATPAVRRTVSGSLLSPPVCPWPNFRFLCLLYMSGRLAPVVLPALAVYPAVH